MSTFGLPSGTVPVRDSQTIVLKVVPDPFTGSVVRPSRLNSLQELSLTRSTTSDNFRTHDTGVVVEST